MPLYLIHRPAGADHMKNPAGIHGALVDAASGPAAITAANALAPDLNSPFNGYTAVLVAATAQGGFVNHLHQPDHLLVWAVFTSARHFCLERLRWDRA